MVWAAVGEVLEKPSTGPRQAGDQPSGQRRPLGNRSQSDSQRCDPILGVTIHITVHVRPTRRLPVLIHSGHQIPSYLSLHAIAFFYLKTPNSFPH